MSANLECRPELAREKPREERKTAVSEKPSEAKKVVEEPTADDVFRAQHGVALSRSDD